MLRFRIACAVFCFFSLFSALCAQDPPQYGTPFEGVVDPRDAIIYQVNIRAFSERGNFQGVIDRLDHICSLGVSVIYLMPYMPIGQLKSVNSPYCIRSYREVNTEFGTLDDLRRLIEEAHDRGMAVILDFVANHTAWDHPWIVEHPEWYAHDDQGAIRSPGSDGFVWADVAQLNFDNQAMRTAMIDNMRYWVFSVNCDGYRFDYADGPPISFWQEACASLRSIPGRNLILYAEGGRFDNFSVFDFNHGFSFYDGLREMFGPAQITALKVEGENNYHYQGAHDTNRIVRFITNHDVNGSDGVPQDLLGGADGAMAAFVLAAFNHGVPMIYNGQEIGLEYRLEFPFTGQDIDWQENHAITDTYKQLLHFRNASPAIRRGSPVSFSTPDVSAFIKAADADTVLVLVNIRNRSISYNLPSQIAGRVWHHAFDDGKTIAGSQVVLNPYEYVVATVQPAATTVRQEGARSKPGFQTAPENAAPVEVFDSKGRLVYRGRSDPLSPQGVRAPLPAGVYLVHFLSRHASGSIRRTVVR